MTYKEIVDRFEQAANQHYMIKDFGYGELSDIKPQSQDNEADYPYMFLNPTPHNRNGVVLSYNFNLIMMDIATDEHDEHSNFLAIQSKCTQYIDDIIAEMYYGYTDKPEINMSNITYTPFKERFQDSLAGMTATITIDVPTPINRCTAPIGPLEPVIPPTTGELVVDVYSNRLQTFEPDVTQSPLECDTIVLTDGGWRLPPSANYYIPQTQDNYNWRIEGTVTFLKVETGDTFRPLEIQDVGNFNRYTPTTNYGWPTSTPVIGQEYPFVLMYNDIPWSGSQFEAVNVIDTPEAQAKFVTGIGTNVKIYRNI